MFIMQDCDWSTVVYGEYQCVQVRLPIDMFAYMNPYANKDSKLYHVFWI